MPLALLATPPHSTFFAPYVGDPTAEAESAPTKRVGPRMDRGTARRGELPMGLALLRLPVAGQMTRKPRLAGPPPPHVLAPYVGLRPVPPAPARLAA